MITLSEDELLAFIVILSPVAPLNIKGTFGEISNVTDPLNPSLSLSIAADALNEAVGRLAVNGNQTCAVITPDVALWNHNVATSVVHDDEGTKYTILSVALS